MKRLSDGGVYALKEADVRKMSPLERADAVNEIRLLASVKHQNVVRYHEAFLDGVCLPVPSGALSGQNGSRSAYLTTWHFHSLAESTCCTLRADVCQLLDEL